MNRRKRFALYISSFAVTFTLMLVIFFPVFNGKTGLNIIGTLLDDNIDINPVADPQNNTSVAFHYWYAPENSFGISVIKSVNWSFFDTCFTYEKFYENESSDYELEVEYNETNNSNVRKYKYKLKTEDEGYYGLNIVFDSEHTVYNFFENNYSFIVYYADDNIVYNFTDIVETFNGDINYYVANDIFYLELGKWLDADIEFEIDPTFGYTTGGASNVNIENIIQSSWGEATGGTGTADNISVYLYYQSNYDENVKCALYQYVDYSSSYAGNLLATTEEIFIDADSLTTEWVTFNFSDPKPTINDNTKYYMAVWGDSGAGTCFVKANSGSGYSVYDALVYTPPANFPSPLVEDTTSTYRRSIYCSYTVGAANNAPTLSGEVPANQSTGVTEGCVDLYVLCLDADGHTMNATWSSNSSGGWVDFATNSSIANNTNITQSNCNFSACGTRYYWRVNLSDGNGGYINETYYFTTAACPTFQIINNTVNWTYSNLTTSKIINQSINWTYSNVSTRAFQIINQSINWTYTNLTTIKIVNQSINWTYTNTTQNKIINSSINWTYSNVSALSFQIINNTVNWTYTNTTASKVINSSINWTYTNLTVIKIINQSINWTYTNTTLSKIINSSINWTYTNDTITWNIINNTVNWTYTNTSLIYNITITDEYPVNESDTIPNNPALYVTINSTDGLKMNISFYYGNYSVLLGTLTNQTNGTYYNSFANASGNLSTYYWSVRLNDGTNWLNNTFSFETEGAGIIISTPSNTGPLIGLAASCFLLLFILIIKRRRKKHEEED